MRRPNELLRYAIYARVSTLDQTCETQLRDLRVDLARRGGILVGEYVDTGWSGSRKSRPNLNRLLADVKAGKIDAVLVWKIDRFGRNLKNFMEHIDILKEHDVRFIATTQGIDTADETGIGAFFLRLLVLVAELELSLIKERTAASRLRRMTDEKPDSWCLPQLVFEMFKDWPRFKKGGKEIMQQIFQWREEGNSVYEIEDLAAAKGIKAPRGGKLEHSAITKLLKSRCMITEYHRGSLTGAAVTKGGPRKMYTIKDCDGNVLRVIPDEQFFRVQKMMASVKNRKQGRPSDNLLLRGWVTCHKCGKRCTGQSAASGTGQSRARNEKILYYRCGGSTNKKRDDQTGRYCSGCYHNAAKTDEAVWRELWDKVITNPENVRELGLAWVAEQEAATGSKRDPHKLLKLKKAELARIVETYTKSNGRLMTYEQMEAQAMPVRDQIESLEIEARSTARVIEIAPVDKIAAACARITGRKEPQELKNRRAILEMLLNLQIVKEGNVLVITGEFPVAEEAAAAAGAGANGGSNRKNCGYHLTGIPSSFAPIPFKIQCKAA